MKFVPIAACAVLFFPAILAVALLSAVPAQAEREIPAAELTGFPFSAETLNYSVNFPSGISMGEAHLTAKRDALQRWNFSFALDASLPNFPILDRFTAAATQNLCGIRSDRTAEHGLKKAKESTVIDRSRLIAVRATAGGGGLSEIPVSACPRDALTFLYYLRRELGQGRMPANETVLAGAPYQLRMIYAGEKSITKNKRQVPVDQVNCTIRGPASEVHLEVLFARDASRTPLVIRCPLSLGTFSLELLR